MTEVKMVKQVHPVCGPQCEHEGVVPVFPGPIAIVDDGIDWADIQARVDHALVTVEPWDLAVREVWLGDGPAPFDQAVLARNRDPEQAPYPAPLVTSDDPMMPDTIKAPVVKLAGAAEALGWATHITYAEGCYPHSTTARPGASKESLAVRMRRGGYGAVAVYVGGSSWSWDYLYVWGPDQPWTKYGTQKAFLERLAVG